MPDTHWELWSLDVWGNAESGWWVNDRSCLDRDFVIPSTIKTYNEGTPGEFTDDLPSNAEIVAALIDGGELTAKTTVDDLTIDGDGESFFIEETDNGFPIFQLQRNQ